MKDFFAVLLLVISFVPGNQGYADATDKDGKTPMINIQQTGERLQAHLRDLTQTIGERSMRYSENLNKTAGYIQSFYEEI